MITGYTSPANFDEKGFCVPVYADGKMGFELQESSDVVMLKSEIMDERGAHALIQDSMHETFRLPPASTVSMP